MESLGAKALKRVQPAIDIAAKATVTELLAKQTFDGVADFASALPLRVVGELVGVPVEPRQLMAWARRSFDGNGPLTNPRALRATTTALSLGLYTARLSPARVAPNSWAASVLAAGERGELGRFEAKRMVIDFVAPSLDTTILAAAQLLWSLGSDADAWNRVRAEPDLIPIAVMEAVRLASPVRGFVRTLTQDVEIDDVGLRTGDRVAVLFASANLDEEQFPVPERFDLNRRGANVGWGYGAHACVGMYLSKMEMESLLRAMVEHVDRISVSWPHQLINNGLQGFRAFRATFT
jgi:cytochrome P450